MEVKCASRVQVEKGGKNILEEYSAVCGCGEHTTTAVWHSEAVWKEMKIRKVI